MYRPPTAASTAPAHCRLRWRPPQVLGLRGLLCFGHVRSATAYRPLWAKLYHDRGGDRGRRRGGRRVLPGVRPGREDPAGPASWWFRRPDARGRPAPPGGAEVVPAGTADRGDALSGGGGYGSRLRGQPVSSPPPGFLCASSRSRRRALLRERGPGRASVDGTGTGAAAPRRSPSAPRRFLPSPRRGWP